MFNIDGKQENGGKENYASMIIMLDRIKANILNYHKICSNEMDFFISISAKGKTFRQIQPASCRQNTF